MTAEPGAVADESHWDGIEETVEDPEEVRVIFSALDSFLSVQLLLLLLECICF